MHSIGQDVLAPIRARLSQLRIMREKYGVLLQDFEREKGEVFCGNYTPAKFDALPFTTKRKGQPAYVVRLFSERAKGPEEAKGTRKIVRVTYEEAYGDKNSVGVFVRASELDMLGIDY